MSIERSIEQFIEDYRLIARGDRILIGISGGPDSIFLSHFLLSRQNRYGIKIRLAHINHNWRKESRKDRRFVEDFAKNHNCPLSIHEEDNNGRVPSSNAEEQARNVRLRFFFDIAKKEHIDKIALAHSMDDQAETVLMRLLRGSGLQGLQAMSPKKVMEGHCLIRPLLRTKRDAIFAYLTLKNIAFSLDPTNTNDAFFRNRIRNKLLPVLKEEFQSNITEVLANTSAHLADAQDYLLHASHERFGEIATVNQNRVEIALDPLKREHPAIQHLLIRLACEKLDADLSTLTARHMEEIENFLHNLPDRSQVFLPQNLQVEKDRQTFTLCRRKT